MKTKLSKWRQTRTAQLVLSALLMTSVTAAHASMLVDEQNAPQGYASYLQSMEGQQSILSETTPGEVNGETKVVKININTASAVELAAALRGVGKARAEAIVALREELGGFSDVEQLLMVRGLGMKVINDNREKMEL
ncbi:ComEA family DNA-binding protein [Aliidiomarina haloalkalitolerans]|uniref:Competence protein ComEA n=1 Tax=Aliidiomarina haloalkalitolerans TaxID=859059 RepID=A0A432VYH6_9GAMM|nr:helix-hairpin-helix domain-containing protein [Aliidiomarina haloalkalitolerans]RUO21721.1 hypothetical protein CWE06_02395 [Aliidiomarina haloalkalitolerans]